MRRQPPLFREPQSAAAGASRTASVVARRVGLATIVALFLSFSGAFGSDAAPWGERLLYWMLSVGTGSIIGVGAAQLFERSGWRDGPLWRVWLLMTLAIAGPTLVGAWSSYGLVFGAGRFELRLLPQFVAPVLAVCAVMVGLSLLLDKRVALTHAAPSPTALAAAVANSPAAVARLRCRFLERLPSRLKGADLHAVEAQDHYLKLHTSRGSTLILLRLADAMVELEGLEGARTHRSWWVARDAVESAARGDGRATLRLKGGVEAPVSRTYARGLHGAGWF